jgi:hypothetical protein
MTLQTLQGLRPCTHLMACKLARPFVTPKPMFEGPSRRRKIAYKHSLLITKSSDDFDAQLEKDINESTQAVDAMVQEISKNLFIDTATAYVVGENATAEAFQEAVATAVKARLDTLNETFLPIINSYVESVEESGENKDLLGLLLAIKGQVLSQLAERLPPEMRIIQKALESSGAEERMQFLRNETSSSTNAINPGSLAFTVARMIADFEGDDEEAAEEVADRGLLARLCLLREELRQLADEAEMTPWKKTSGNGTSGGSDNETNEVNVEVMLEGENDYTQVDQQNETDSSDSDQTATAAAPAPSASPYTALRGVPAREVSFLKDIMGVASSEKRRGLLETAFRGNTNSNNTSGSTTIGIVRPGAFMDCIKALQAEMLGPKYGYGADTNQGTLLRLEEVWRESILVLEDIAGDANYMP